MGSSHHDEEVMNTLSHLPGNKLVSRLMCIKLSSKSPVAVTVAKYSLFYEFPKNLG